MCPMVPCDLQISGNQGWDMVGGTGLVPGGIVNQTIQTLDNIKKIVETAGATMDDLTYCEVWLQDLSDFGAMNDVYKTYFTEPYPTRAAGGGWQLAMGGLVEMTCSGQAPCQD